MSSPLFFSPPANFHNTLLSLQGNELPVVTDTPPPEPPVSLSVSRELIDRIVIIFEAAYFCFRAALYEPCFLLAHSVVTIIKVPVFLSILTFNGFSHLLGKEGYTNVDIQESFLAMHFHAIKIVQYTFSALTFLLGGIPFSPMKARLFKHHEIKLEDYKIALQSSTVEASEDIPPTTPRSPSPSPSPAILTQDAETITDYLFSDFPDVYYPPLEGEEILEAEETIEANEKQGLPAVEEAESTNQIPNQNPAINEVTLKEGAIDLTCIDTYRKYYISELIKRLKIEKTQNKTKTIKDIPEKPSARTPQTLLKPRALNFVLSAQSDKLSTPGGQLPSTSTLIQSDMTPSSSLLMTPLRTISEQTTIQTQIQMDIIGTPSPLNRSSISSISPLNQTLSPISETSKDKHKLINQLTFLRSIRFAHSSVRPLFSREFTSLEDFLKVVFPKGTRPEATQKQILQLIGLSEQATKLLEEEELNFQKELIQKIEYYYDLIIPLVLKTILSEPFIDQWQTVQELQTQLETWLSMYGYELSTAELLRADEEVFQTLYSYPNKAIMRFLSQLKNIPKLTINDSMPFLKR